MMPDAFPPHGVLWGFRQGTDVSLQPVYMREWTQGDGGRSSFMDSPSHRCVGILDALLFLSAAVSMIDGLRG